MLADITTIKNGLQWVTTANVSMVEAVCEAARRFSETGLAEKELQKVADAAGIEVSRVRAAIVDLLRLRILVAKGVNVDGLIEGWSESGHASHLLSTFLSFPVTPREKALLSGLRHEQRHLPSTTSNLHYRNAEFRVEIDVSQRSLETPSHDPNVLMTLDVGDGVTRTLRISPTELGHMVASTGEALRALSRRPPRL